MRAERVSLLVLLKVPHLKGARVWAEEVEGGGRGMGGHFPVVVTVGLLWKLYDDDDA